MRILEAVLMFSEGRESTLLSRVLSSAPAVGKEGSVWLGT